MKVAKSLGIMAKSEIFCIRKNLDTYGIFNAFISLHIKYGIAKWDEPSLNPMLSLKQI